METKQVIAAMLTENTGRHMLDSGGAYGRHWQDNQGKDFDQQPVATARFSNFDGNLELTITLSLYHWLNERVDFSETMQKKFDVVSEANPDDCWPEIVGKFIKSLKLDVDYHGEENSYNHGDLLSQCIQWWEFEYDGVDYIILQIHGGCDLRGGYTAPKIFETLDDHSIYGYCRGSIACPNCHAGWDVEDSYTQSFNGEDNLKDLPVVDATAETAENYRRLAVKLAEELKLQGDIFGKTETAGLVQGKLLAMFPDIPAKALICDENENGYCPYCKTRLEAGF